MMSEKKGFTLLEMMIVVMIVGIIAAVAFPSYQVFVRKSQENNAQQEIQKIVKDLEHQKSRQFSYLGFALSPDPLYLPYGATSTTAKYKIEVMDGDTPTVKLNATTAPLGKNWVIRALSTDGKIYSYLVNSNGTSCKNKTYANVTFATCGTGSEAWKLP
jgi:type IV pilus assembly protein PilE